MVSALDLAARSERRTPYNPRGVPERDDPLTKPDALPARSRRALARAFGRARRIHGDHGIAPHAFIAHALAVIARRRRAADLATTPADLASSIDSAALEDLYLALACEQGSEVAWAQLSDTFLPRLTGLAVRRGARGADAEAAASAFLARLALPPATGGMRTAIGTYSAAGALWAWLAVGLNRHLQREVAKARRTQGEAIEHAAPAADAASAHVEDEEVVAGAARELARGLATLDSSERVAFVWKHRDGLPQNRIAELMGVPPYQVSRWISRAVDRLRAALGLTSAGAGEEIPWDALSARVSGLLATTGVEEAPRHGNESQVRDE